MFATDYLELIYPTTEKYNFGVSDSVVFKTNYAIDFTLMDPEFNIDGHNIMIVPTQIINNVHDSLWTIFKMYGVFNQIDTNIFSIKFYNLDFETEYSLVVDSLITGTIHRNEIDTVWNSFIKTQPNMPYISSINNHTHIRCKDSIEIQFLGPIDTLMFPTDLFIELWEIDSVELKNNFDTLWVDYDSNLVKTDSITSGISIPSVNVYKRKINFQRNYDTSSRKLKLWLNNGFDIDKEYLLSANISMYTGDIENDIIFNFSTKKEGSFVVKSETLDTNKTLHNELRMKHFEKTHPYYPNDSIVVEAPLKKDSCIFYKWQSNDLEFDEQRENKILINKSCENLSDIELIAIYIFPCIDTININYDTNDVKIKVKGYKDSLDYNKFTLLKSPYDSISILPMPKSI